MGDPIRWLLIALVGGGLACVWFAGLELETRTIVLESQLAVARESASVEYSARQCMVTVARGDYDDYLRQLGWSRGAR
ncbi:MAG: hypothetical protein V4479_07435 [Actinomycetota bacterium]